MSKPTQQRQQRKNKSAKDRTKARLERIAHRGYETWPVNPVAVFEAAEQIFTRGPEPKAPTVFRVVVPIGLGKDQPTGAELVARTSLVDTNVTGQ